MILFSKTISPERFFLLSGLLFGLLYYLFTPPFQSPDEFNHFYRAFQVSEGRLLPERLPDRLGGHLPESINDFYNTFRFAEITHDFRFRINHLTETFQISIDPGKRVFCDFANTSNYSPVSYLPQALTIALLRFFGGSLGFIYYGGKLITFLAWLASVHFSIKQSPVFKWLLAFLALLPTNLYIASSFSADNVTNILAFLWISQVLRLTFSDVTIRRRTIIVLSLIAAGLAIAKIVYVALILLIFMIPRERFCSLRQQTWYRFVICVPALVLALLWAKLASGYHISYDDYSPEFRVAATLSPGSDYTEQLKLVLSDVTYFPRVIFNSVFNPYQFYLHSYVAAYGTHLYHHLPAPVWILAYVIILYTALLAESRVRLSSNQLVIVLLAFFISFVLVLLANHLYWDPVGSGYVGLVQGRYLVPLFPLLFMTLNSVLGRGRNSPKWPVIMTAVVINTLSLILLYQIFFREPYKKVTEAYTGFENGAGDQFISSNPEITFSGLSNRTTIQKRSGVASVMVAPHSPYAAGHTFPQVAFGDVIEFEVWRKGSTGVAVLAADEKNCRPYMIQHTITSFDGEEGWQKMHCWYRNNDSCNQSAASFYLYNLSPDTAYFDDLTLRHRKHTDLRDK